MTTDPYPDLTGIELASERAPVDRTGLSEAERRLLDALSRPAPPVVTAVEDQARASWSAQDVRAPALGGHGPLTPVFREPTD